MTDQLFEVDLAPIETDDIGAKPSADRRRTARQRAAIANGQHPTGNGPIDASRRCGECAHCVPVRVNRLYWKCDVSRLGRSACASSDIRKSWPACPRFEVGIDA